MSPSGFALGRHEFSGWDISSSPSKLGNKCILSPRKIFNIVDRGGTEVNNTFRGMAIYIPYHPIKNVILILLYRMPHFYNKFQCMITDTCRVTFKIVTLLTFSWQIRLLEISMRYNNWFNSSPYTRCLCICTGFVVLLFCDL